MTTLAFLKEEIADDLERTDLDSQIASEITRAIRHYQNKRFYFNETRDETFSTVAAQKLYSSADDTAIPKFIEIDQIYVMDGDEPVELERISPKQWELETADTGDTGIPTSFTYFNRSIGLSPIPDDAYTVRIVGHIMKDAPATDGEADNVWMTEAFDLIRARVCVKIGQRKTRDGDLVNMARADEVEELSRLTGETAIRTGTGFITPTEF